MMPVMRPGGAPAATVPANGSLKRPLEAPSAMPASGGFAGDGAGGFAGDAKRQRSAAPIVPPAQERLPDASSPPLSVLKEKFEHLKQEVSWAPSCMVCVWVWCGFDWGGWSGDLHVL